MRFEGVSWFVKSANQKKGLHTQEVHLQRNLKGYSEYLLFIQKKSVF